MSYCKKICKAGSVIDVMEYHTARYGSPGQKREKKRKATPEEMKKANQRNKARKCWHQILVNFRIGDYFLNLTYRQDARPAGMAAAKEDFRVFVRRLRKEYRKKGYDLKWIRNIEVGSRGAWHVHLIANRVPGGIDLIMKLWPHGRIQASGMYPEGRFRKLAEYITKSPVTEQRIKESNYSTSRNLITPVPEVKHYLFYRTWRKIRIPKGYYLDPESLVEGVNQWTGYPYRSYMLVRDDFDRRMLC